MRYLALILFAGMTSAAFAGHHHGCPCYPECKTEPNEKTCNTIECDQVCIPAVKFPWESCCCLKPGRTRTIHKLGSKDYECGTKRVWDWSIKKKDNGSNGAAGCCDGTCEASCGAAPLPDQPAPADVEQPEAPTPAAADEAPVPPVSQYLQFFPMTR